LMQTRGNINASKILNALSEILAIPHSKLFVQSMNLAGLQPYEQLVKEELNGEGTSNNSMSNQLFDGQLSSYKFGIKPDLYNNIPSSVDIASQLFTQSNQAKLFDLVPEYALDLGVRIAPILGTYPEYIVQPNITDVGYYTVEISAELIDSGRIYGIAILSNSSAANYTPTSYQIAHGWTANNTPVEEGFFNISVSDATGRVMLVLDELREDSEYNIYVTSGDNLPYDAINLLKNDQVVTLKTKTLKNPNVGNIAQSMNLYDEYYEADDSFGGRLKLSFTFLILLFCLFL